MGHWPLVVLGGDGLRVDDAAAESGVGVVKLRASGGAALLVWLCPRLDHVHVHYLRGVSSCSP